MADINQQSSTIIYNLLFKALLRQQGGGGFVYRVKIMKKHVGLCGVFR